MSLTYGPKSGLLFGAAQGEQHYTALMAQWRGLDANWGGLVVENLTQTSPPGTGADGESFIVGTGGTGAFSGKDGNFARRNGTNGSFEFFVPFAGMVVWDKATGAPWRYSSGAWAPEATPSVFSFKSAVRAISATNITLSGAQTIDGVSVVAGNRVLVAGQSTAANNGIYVCASGAWSRATDADSSAEVKSGMIVPVSEGTAYADTLWLLTTNDPITLGSTAIAFSKIASTTPAATAATPNTLALRDSMGDCSFHALTASGQITGNAVYGVTGISADSLGTGNDIAGTFYTDHEDDHGIYIQTTLNDGDGCGAIIDMANTVGDHLGDAIRIQHNGGGHISGRALSVIEASAEVAHIDFDGKATFNTIRGGSAASENLFLSSTSHATKGGILFGTSAYDEANNRLGLGTASPSWPLDLQTAAGAASAVAYGARFQQTLTAAANNDDLVALYVNPTFNDNSKTGVTHKMVKWGSVAFVAGDGKAMFPQLDGSTASGGDLTLESTTHATKGKIIASDTFKTASGRIKALRKITAAGAVTVGDTDDTIIMAKSSPATTAITGPTAVAGRRYTVKDGNGDCQTNNITITPAAGNIDGAASLVLNVNYDSVTLECDGTNWWRV